MHSLTTITKNNRERGVVINDKDSNVGEILGDGLVLTFSDPSSIETFDVCLRIAQNEKAKYDVPDFGYSTEELESIRPLGLFFRDKDRFFCFRNSFISFFFFFFN